MLPNLESSEKDLQRTLHWAVETRRSHFIRTVTDLYQRVYEESSLCLDPSKLPIHKQTDFRQMAGGAGIGAALGLVFGGGITGTIGLVVGGLIGGLPGAVLGCQIAIGASTGVGAVVGATVKHNDRWTAQLNACELQEIGVFAIALVYTLSCQAYGLSTGTTQAKLAEVQNQVRGATSKHAIDWTQSEWSSIHTACYNILSEVAGEPWY